MGGVLKDASDLRVPTLLRRRIRLRKHNTPPVMEAFIKNARATIEKDFRGVARASEVPGFLRFSRRWLQANSLWAELRDKDGVSVVIPDRVVITWSWSSLESLATKLEPGFLRVQRGLFAISRLRDRISVRSHAARATCDQMLCPLLATTKTHKQPVTCRLVYSSTNSIFNGLGSALNRILEPRLRSIHQFCLSSEHAAQRVPGIKTGPMALFLKYDV
jgi:hypothetical protein